jgi:Mlc titration factor MtfA (ptsG expression regulator)
MIVLNEAEDFPFIVKMSSNETKMKKQCKVFTVDEKMQTLTEVNSCVGTRMVLAAMLGLSVLKLNTIVSQ